MMNLKHLAVFHAVARTGGISRAAQELYVSQPVVSRQVRELESSLGLILLERMPRGVRLTEAGAILADYAERIFSLSQRAETVLQDLRGLRAGGLHLGASTTIGSYLLPPVLAEFQRRHPGVEVSLEIGNTSVIQRRLLANQIDVGFTEGFADAGELRAEVFMRDELVIIAPADHPLAGGPAVPLASLCGEPCVMREPGSGTRAVLEQVLRERGLVATPVMSVGSPEAVKRAVMAGIGLAVVSYLTVSAELEASLLAHIPVADLALRRPLHRVQLPHRQHGPALAAFLPLLDEAVRRLEG